MDFSIVLPTYNESENIVELIEFIIKVYSGENNIDIIVTDDNSPDGTGEIVKRVFKDNSSVRTIIRETDNGLAKSLLEGISMSRYRYVILMDSDFNHNPADIQKMLNIISSCDMVIGSRYKSAGGMRTSKTRYLLSMIFNYFVKFTLWVPFSDSLSGYIMFDKEKFKFLFKNKIFYGYGDYAIRLLYLADKMKINYKEIPVVYDFRHGGVSKTSFIKTFIKYTLSVMRIRFGELNEFENKISDL